MFEGERLANKWEVERKASSSPPPPCQHENLSHICFRCLQPKNHDCSEKDVCIYPEGVNFICAKCKVRIRISNRCPKCGNEKGNQINGTGKRLFCFKCKFTGKPEDMEVIN